MENKNIELFHSYNYIQKNYILKENKIYDTNNNLLVILLNIPSNNSNIESKKLYSIKIKKKTN